MPEPTVKTRFAPSPTGRLHLGNARTALFNALRARQAGGVFLLRVEDTDPERSREAYLDGLVEDLRWLGLEWHEGFGVGGAAGPYRQSERGAIYARYFDRLLAEGRAYPCFCSAERLEGVRRTQIARGLPPRYDGACAGLSSAEARARAARGEAAALRFRVPEVGAVEFEDLVRGPQRFETGVIGDFVIRRADGGPAFFFTNALDDALMGVTEVLRAEDHLSNTPRQVLLLRALDLPVPRYGHVSLIVDARGAPLSKRAGSASLADLRARGYLPRAVVNYLARLGHHYAEGECLDLAGLAAGFDPAALGSAPARFEEAQLQHWQHAALAVEDGEALWSWLGEETRGQVPGALGGAFIDAIRGNVRFPAEAAAWAGRLFGPDPRPDAAAIAEVRDGGAAFFQAALGALDAGAQDLAALVTVLRARTGRSGKALFRPLRAALTGTLEGPELARVFSLLGAGRVRERLAAAAAIAAGAAESLHPEDGRS